MSFLEIWRQKNPGKPDPNDATLWEFVQPTLSFWREEHPGQPDPDIDTLYIWLCRKEREDMEEEWREAFPGKPLPDDYQTLRRWAIDEDNKMRIAFLRRMGETWH